MSTDPIPPDQITPVIDDLIARLGECEREIAELARSNSIARHNAESALQAFTMTNDRVNQLAVRVDAIERPPTPVRRPVRGALQLGEDFVQGRAEIIAVHEAIPGPDHQLDVRMTIALKPDVKPVSSGS